MFKSRISADLIAILEGFIWLLLAWSISVTIWLESSLPFFFTSGIVIALVLIAWMHKPLRITMQRFRTRRRRTEMYMHLFSLPVILALLLTIIIETLFSMSLNGFHKTLLVNIMATSGWIFFILTLVIKQLHFVFNSRNFGRHS